MKGGIIIFVQGDMLFFWSLRTHAKFQNRSLPPSGLILVSGLIRRRRFLLIIKASLATAEVSAGGWPIKASFDMNNLHKYTIFINLYSCKISKS